MNYPLKYDSVDQTIDDANGVVIAVLSWPGLKREIDTINSYGEEMVNALNNKNAETERGGVRKKLKSLVSA